MKKNLVGNLKLTEQQKVQYKKKYINLAQYTVVKDGILDIPTNWEKSESLINEVIKHKQITSYISKLEILGEIYKNFLSLRNYHKQCRDFAFADKITPLELDAGAEKFISFLEGLPYEYYFYFHLPIELPEKIPSIKLTDNIEILRPLKTEENFFILPTPVSPYDVTDKIFMPNENDVFFKIKVPGYGDGAHSKAISIFKQFLYLTNISCILTSYPWDRPNKSLPLKNKYKVPVLNGAECISFTLPSEVTQYVSRLTLNKNMLDSASTGNCDTYPNVALGGLANHRNLENCFISTFLKGCKSFITLCENMADENTTDKKITNKNNYLIFAIEWGFDGTANLNTTMGFIQTCIGLEAMLGDADKHSNSSGRSLSEKLADRCAYALENTRSGRSKRASEFKKIYNLRSRLVHGDYPKVPDEDFEMTIKAEYLLKELLLRELFYL